MESLQGALDTLSSFDDHLLSFSFNEGASEAQIAVVEAEIGLRLPESLRELYLLHDGQGWQADPLFTDLRFLPLAELVGHWQADRAVGLDDEPDPLAHDRRFSSTLSSPGWIPIAAIQGACVLYVDVDPMPTGTIGQVILGGYEHQNALVAPSIAGLIRRLALAARSGEITAMETPFGRVWGVGPSAVPLSLSLDWLARDEPTTGYPDWVAHTDPAWHAYLTGRGPGFAELFTKGNRRVTVPAGATTLDPLRHIAAPLFALDLTGYGMATLNELHDFTELYSLWLDRVDSLDGIGRLQILTNLTIANSAGLDLAPLADVPALYRIEVLEPARGFSSIRERPGTFITATVETPAQLREVLAIPGGLGLRARDTSLDVDEWALRSASTNEFITGGVSEDLAFLEHLPLLRTLDLDGTKVRRVHRLAGAGLLKISIKNIEVPDDIDSLSALTLTTDLRLPRAWYERLKHTLPPFVCGGLSDPQDTPDGLEESMRLQRARTSHLSSLR